MAPLTPGCRDAKPGIAGPTGCSDRRNCLRRAPPGRHLPAAVAWRRRRVPSAAGPEHGGAHRAAAPCSAAAAAAGCFLRGRGAGQPRCGQPGCRTAGRPGLPAAAERHRGGRAAAARAAPPRVGPRLPSVLPRCPRRPPPASPLSPSLPWVPLQSTHGAGGPSLSVSVVVWQAAQPFLALLFIFDFSALLS